MKIKGLVVFRYWLQIAVAALLACGGCQAQMQKDEATKNLPESARATLDQLGNLSHLPMGTWRYHTGDVAHGESPSLDDSTWPTARVNGEYPEDALWFRQWIEVPKTLNGYDLTGAQIWFRFDAWVNGPLPQIIYFNGRRVAMGDDLEPIVLFDHAQPGERERALADDLVRPVAGHVLHEHDDSLGALDEIHGATHPLDHLAGDHPVGEVAILDGKSTRLNSSHSRRSRMPSSA